MSRRARPPPDPQGDLFGGPPAPRRKDDTPVEIPLQRLSESDGAWLLRPGLRGAPAKWAPKALVSEVEGRSGVWRMPRWIADERGWGVE